MCVSGASICRWSRSASDESIILLRTAIYIPACNISVTGVIMYDIISSDMVFIMAATIDNAALACNCVGWYAGYKICFASRPIAVNWARIDRIHGMMCGCLSFGIKIPGWE